MSTVAAQQLVVRPRRVRRVAAGAAVALVAVFTVVAVLLKNTPTGAFFRTSDQVAMVLVGLLLASAAMLFTRPRLRADANGIEVRNLVATRYFEWPVVLKVSFPDGAPWARVDLADDEYFGIMAIQSVDGQHAVQAVRALRALHAEATGG